MNLRVILIFSAFLLISSCKKDTFEIQTNYVNMYVELLLAYENYNSDTKKFYQAKNGILSNYPVSYTDLKKHIQEIQKRPELWEPFQNQVQAKLKEIKINYKGE